MRTKIALTIFGSLAAVAFASPAAAQSFYSTFENVPGGPGYGGYTTVDTADGWTGTHGIELQNHVAGNPASSGGNVFVELDTDQNSTMSRLLSAGTYDLSFLYSARPGVSAESNGIDVLLNGVSIYSIAQDGTANGDTVWSTQNLKPFYAAAGSTLSFAATGTSDGVGGYIDNIRASAVPEPATWAMMMVGFGMVGFGLRRRSKVTTSVRFA